MVRVPKGAQDRYRAYETERLVLLPAQADLTDAVLDYRERVHQFAAPWEPLREASYWTRPALRKRLAIDRENALFDRGYAFHIASKESPKTIIGAINVNNVVRGAMQGASLGYGLAPEATGRGYMTEAVNAIVALSFTVFGLHRIEVNIIPRNARSLAVVRRCGFAEEGLQPRFLLINGAWEDHLRFARINDVWEKPSWVL